MKILALMLTLSCLSSFATAQSRLEILEQEKQTIIFKIETAKGNELLRAQGDLDAINREISGVKGTQDKATKSPNPEAKEKRPTETTAGGPKFEPWDVFNQLKKGNYETN
jgi:hypothetical protein